MTTRTKDLIVASSLSLLVLASILTMAAWVASEYLK